VLKMLEMKLLNICYMNTSNVSQVVTDHVITGTHTKFQHWTMRRLANL